jgi:predicted SAM-dependent methyltransferase
MNLPANNNSLYQSETSKHRDRLAAFCQGFGMDIGFGGDPITPTAIRMDFPTPYANTGGLGVQLGGDSRDLRWFKDGVLDFVYSSHVLEDFSATETEPVLREWTRVLKPGGRLILLLPDQQKYVEHCRRTGQWPNEHHSIANFSLTYVKAVAERIGNLKLQQGEEGIDEYSFFVVFEKIRPANEPQDKMQLLQNEQLRLRQENAELNLKLRRKTGALEWMTQKLRQTTQPLERYIKHPAIKFMKAVYFFPRKFTQK